MECMFPAMLPLTSFAALCFGTGWRSLGRLSAPPAARSRFLVQLKFEAVLLHRQQQRL